MLEESIEIMRALWEGGQVSHDGDHYTVQNARLYTLPGEPVEVIVSGFGPKAISLAAAVGDGFASVAPEAEERNVDRIVAALQAYADAGFYELHVSQIGSRQDEWFEVRERDVLPRFAA